MSLDVLLRSLPRDPCPVRVDPERTESTEKTVLYDCGTAAPGQVHDPCQHSTVTVLCCTCAGCMFDVWACAQAVPADSWVWWEAHVIAERFDPWVRHPYALVLYALLVVFLLASQIVQTVIEILLHIGVVVVAALVFTVTRLLF